MMDLKEFTSTFVNPFPAIKTLREHFRKNDKSVFLGVDFAEKSYIEKFQFFINNYITTYKAIEKQFPDQINELAFNSQFIAPLGSLYLTFNGFQPPVRLLSTPEQLEKWEKLTIGGRLIGAYAQTEIGHGSDVQSLMTTATYNSEKKCFVLNTPSVKAAKYWPGGLGIQCTHAVVQAQTYINGKHQGLQTFVVPLRDPKTYKQHEGVDAGDIGPKLAYSWGDNGYLRFDNYEIPRENLLMKFIKVDEDGSVTNMGDKNAVKISYGGMLGLRVALSKYFMIETYRGIVMGYRGWQKANQLTPINKTKLLKGFAYIYSGILTIEWMTLLHRSFNENIQKNMKKALEEMVELHLVASGLKAYYSWGLVHKLREFSVNQTIGDLLVTGISGLYGDTVPAVTYEGDNAVMLQQTARGLCKYLQHVESEEFEKVPEAFRFLVDLRELLEKPEEIKVRINNAQELLEAGKIEELIDAIGLFSVKENYEKMKEKLINGDSINSTWNEKLQGSMVEMALEVSKGLSFKMTKRILRSDETKRALRASDMEVLEGLLLVYGLDLLEQNINLACKYKIGAEVERWGALIKEAQGLVYKRMESKVEYIADSQLFYEEELYYVRDYKKWSPVDKSDRIKQSLEKNEEARKNYINTFSKL